jgi:hypothetical protein
MPSHDRHNAGRSLDIGREAASRRSTLNCSPDTSSRRG